MLELSLRFVIADETSTDEALIASLPHDLRAIADQVAQAWPGKTLDPSLGDRGQLAHPAHLDLELAHGGRAHVEVRQRSTLAPRPTDREPEPLPRRTPTIDMTLEPLLEALTPPDRWLELQDNPTFPEAIERLERLVVMTGQAQSQNVRRMLQAFAGVFRGLEAKDRSGNWVSAAAAPSVDPYYACAVFAHDGRIQRVPLPQILPEAASSRRSFRLSPETAQLVALLERTRPERLEEVRAAGRTLLDQRRQWMARGRYGK